MPKRPDDISRFCWMGACDDCLDTNCRCDHHLVEASVIVYGKWTAADMAKIAAVAKGRVQFVD